MIYDLIFRFEIKCRMHENMKEACHVHTFPNSTAISKLCAVGFTAREAASE